MDGSSTEKVNGVTAEILSEIIWLGLELDIAA